MTMVRGTSTAWNVVLRPNGIVNSTVDWVDDFAAAGGAGGAGATPNVGGAATGGTMTTGGVPSTGGAVNCIIDSRVSKRSRETRQCLSGLPARGINDGLDIGCGSLRLHWEFAGCARHHRHLRCEYGYHTPRPRTTASTVRR
jgi:hypothetical protein